MRVKTVQTPRGRRTAVGADKFSRSGRKPLRGAFIRLTRADAGHVDRHRQVSMSALKAAWRGIYSVHRGRCGPTGSRTAFPGRRGQVSMFRTKTAQRGVYSVHGGRCGLSVPTGRGTSPSLPADPKQAVVALPLPLGENGLYSLVTRIQSPIKEKP